MQDGGAGRFYLQATNVTLGAVRYKDVRGLEAHAAVQPVTDGFSQRAFTLLCPIPAIKYSFSAVLMLYKLEADGN